MNKPAENEFYTVRGYQLKKQKQSGLTPALEDYLEMAYRLCAREGYTRINKLSECLNVRPPSTSKMVSRLIALGFLEYDRLDRIRLTEKGGTAGAYLMERHHIMERFFSLVGSINPLEETELVEHMLCASTVHKIQALVEFFAQNPSLYRQLLTFIDSAGFAERKK